MEMARVTGVPLSYLQTRGQQIKVKLNLAFGERKFPKKIRPCFHVQLSNIKSEFSVTGGFSAIAQSNETRFSNANVH